MILATDRRKQFYISGYYLDVKYFVNLPLNILAAMFCLLIKRWLGESCYCSDASKKINRIYYYEMRCQLFTMPSYNQVSF